MAEILIVDDDVVVVNQLKSMLHDVASLSVAATGSDALRLCAGASPDLLLLDLHLPDMDGIETFKRLRSLHGMAWTPIVFITGEAGASRQVEAFNVGASDWLQKPLDEGTVRAHIDMALESSRAAKARSAQSLNARDRRPVVMLVDDDRTAIQALGRAMQSLGVECVAAPTGADALRLAFQDPPDLVLLDVQMTGGDGFEVARKLMAHPRCADTPIMFVTRYDDTSVEVRALNMGAYDFIAKPFSEPVLQARVRNVLRQRLRATVAVQQERDRWRHIGNERVADIVANSSDAMLVSNAQGRVVLVNQAAGALFDLPVASVMGRLLPAWLAIAVPREALEETNPERIRSTSPSRVLVQSPSGGAIPCDLTWSATGAGLDRLLTLSFRDLSMQLAAEKEARDIERLESESRAKTLMMSYLAHEIGNPLNGILGFAQLLTMDGAENLTPAQHQHVNQIRDSSELLKRLMADAMDLARWESGQFAMCLSPVPIAAVLNAAMGAVAGQAAVAEVVLAGPEGDLAVMARCDRQRLTQSLINLLTNAIKYGRRGGRVEMAVTAGRAEVAIAVSDEGAGLTALEIERLFRPFDRLGRSGQPGHGLGLVITRILAEAMGGRLEVQSLVGVGSRFTIALPLA